MATAEPIPPLPPPPTSAAPAKKWLRPAATVPPWFRRLSATFRHFFLSEHLVDVTLICRDGKVSAHRLLLAACSPYLKSLLQQGEEDDACVSLPDFDVETVRTFLDAIYLSSVPRDRESYLQLREVCAFFKLPLFGFSSFVFISNVQEEAQTDVGAMEESGALLDNEESMAAKSFTFDNGSGGVSFVQTDGGELLLVNCAAAEAFSTSAGNGDQHAESDAEAFRKVRADRMRAIRDSQHRSCVMCGKRALDHRVQVEDDEMAGKSSLFVYKCCLPSCANKALRSSKVFHVHVGRHDPSLAPMTGSARCCPLCFRSRIEHKNREDGVVDVKGRKKGNIYRCCQCSASKLSAKKFFTHTENHIAKKFPCPDCGKGFSYQHLLDTHAHKEHGDGRKHVFSCPDCGFESKYKQSILSHRLEKHEGVKRAHRQESNMQTVVCPTCKKELKKWYYQQYHKKTCSAGTMIYQCDICHQEGFVNNTTLRNHIRSKHSDERPFVCEWCPARYATAMSLSGHRSRKHNVNKAGEFVPKKMFPCSICGKLLTTRSKLGQHVKIMHDNEKEFKCGFCDKRFTSKSNMRIHEGTIHTGVLPYKCERCQQSFARKAILVQHKEHCHALGAGASEAEMAESADAAAVVVDDFGLASSVSAVGTVEEETASTSEATEAYLVVEEAVLDMMA